MVEEVGLGEEDLGEEAVEAMVAEERKERNPLELALFIE